MQRRSADPLEVPSRLTIAQDHASGPSSGEIPSVTCHVTPEEDQPGTLAPGCDSGAEISRQPIPFAKPVSLKGRMIPGRGYQPENGQWYEVLTTPNGKGIDGQGRDGRDPMSIPPEVLTKAGHPPRRTRAIIKALGDEPIDHEIRRYKDLRQHCIDCSSGSKAEVRRCPIINCPLWPYRMGRNPHNPRRGCNPLQKIE